MRAATNDDSARHLALGAKFKAELAPIDAVDAAIERDEDGVEIRCDDGAKVEIDEDVLGRDKALGETLIARRATVGAAHAELTADDFFSTPSAQPTSDPLWTSRPIRARVRPVRQEGGDAP